MRIYEQPNQSNPPKQGQGGAGQQQNREGVARDHAKKGGEEMNDDMTPIDKVHCLRVYAGESRPELWKNFESWEDEIRDILLKPVEKQEDRMTNADRIRQMSDEELMLDYCGCRHCIHFGKCKADGTYSCDDGVLAWLKKEASKCLTC